MSPLAFTAPVQAPAQSARTARAAYAEAPPSSAGYEALDQTHRAAQQMLAAFEQLLAHLDERGIDVEAEQAASTILAFLDGPARQHHRDEEAWVFPDLLAQGNPALAAHVRRLQQDHGWIEEDWLALRPQIEAVATGYNWYDLDTLRQALPLFAALYQQHIALEEQVVYPAAKALQRAA